MRRELVLAAFMALVEAGDFRRRTLIGLPSQRPHQLGDVGFTAAFAGRSTSAIVIPKWRLTTKHAGWVRGASSAKAAQGPGGRRSSREPPGVDGAADPQP